MRFLEGIIFTLWLISGIRRSQASNIQPLNMSVTAFDDQYEGCTEAMEKEVLQVLLAKEQKDPLFRKTWEKAVEKWRNEKMSLPGGVLKEYGIAITAYTNLDFYLSFNNAVKDYKSWDQFPYHSMHFLLTRALVLLGSCCPKSTTLYRGVKGTSFKQKKGEKIRFGQFTSSSMLRYIAEGFGTDTFFTLTSCFGVPIKDYSHVPYEEEVLIPVDEVFEVTSFTEEGGKSRIVLKTTQRRCHHYNCNYIQKGGKSSKCVYNGGTRMFSSLAVVVLLLFQVIVFS